MSRSCWAEWRAWWADRWPLGMWVWDWWATRSCWAWWARLCWACWRVCRRGTRTTTASRVWADRSSRIATDSCHAADRVAGEREAERSRRWQSMMLDPTWNKSFAFSFVWRCRFRFRLWCCRDCWRFYLTSCLSISLSLSVCTLWAVNAMLCDLLSTAFCDVACFVCNDDDDNDDGGAPIARAVLGDTRGYEWYHEQHEPSRYLVYIISYSQYY